MKKKFTLEIASPCSENFNKMIPNATGSFCNSCAKNVIDLSKKTNSEVAKFIAETKDTNICARLRVTQLDQEFEHNERSKINNLKYAAVAASILLASNVSGQEKTPIKTEVSCPKPSHYLVGKVAQNNVVRQELLITVKGKLLEDITHKPFDRKMYPNLTLSINGSEKTFRINAKTGEFSIPVKVFKSDKTLIITITGDDYYLSKEIPFAIEAVTNKVLQRDIIIAEGELTRIMIAGGLGINYK
ncbi:hypothetical protein L0669_10255 [Flavobacterium bizetiae]|uniref:hypothetical protein n=1 Tax=Flavobacterium bizetiae TaxID=2704140 RepID=UPI0021E6ED5F|nr:hypothetical protein [Flavobacterium bizetiae]UTN06278.1 hypothetical protein L0669_10255 [Flavobacterium bizetiae]